MNDQTKDSNFSLGECSSNNSKKSKDESSFHVQKRKKNRKTKDEMKYVENSPNNKFSRVISLFI